MTPNASKVPDASERGAESEVAHRWAKWLHNPCRLGGPHRFRAAGGIRSRPQVGKVVTEPLPPWWSRHASEVAHKWARWLHNPCCVGGSQRFRAGGRIRRGSQVGKVAT